MFQYKPDYIEHMRPAKNILHIGASYGQETKAYIDKFKDTLSSIVYIEPIPEVYKSLETYMNDFRTNNISITCINSLVSNTDDEEVDFFIANNQGISSSMFKINPECWIWNGIELNTTIKMKTITINKLMESYPLLSDIDTVIIDTQGAEYLVLQGMTKLLPSVTQIVCEFSTKEYYKGGVCVETLEDFLKSSGFKVNRLGSEHSDLICIKDV